LYSRDSTSISLRSTIREILAQKALQTPTFTVTALLAVATTSLAGSEISVQNATTRPEIQNPINSNGTVHWQSAFWALVAIALNSCLQDTGEICGIEAKLGLLVKSSPVFCAFDSVIVWGQILYYITRVPPREALRIVAKSREQHNPDAEEESKSTSVIIGRWILLVLAVLQGLKLYALRGIPWTQAFGTLYLFSYATNAILNVMGKPQTNEETEMRRGDVQPSIRLIHRFAMVAACLQIAIWITIVGPAVPDHWLTTLAQKRCGWPIDAATVIWLFPLLILLYIPFTLLGILAIGLITTDIVILLFLSGAVLFCMNFLVHRFFPSFLKIVADVFGCGVETMRYTFAGLFTVVAALVEVCLLGWFPLFNAFAESKTFEWLVSTPRLDSILHEWVTYKPYGFAFLALGLTAMISYFLHRIFCMGSIARKVKATSLGLSSNLGWACLFMFLANISLTLLYYGHVYSPEGTSKPSWTDNLGRKFL
jgi:hypothetical protein